MKYTTLYVFLLAISALSPGRAQSVFEFHVVAQPGMTIGGHTFTPNTTIQSVALNDAGEVAFIARWTDAGTEHASVFTADRIIAMEGDVFEFNRIGTITKDCTVAINNAGQIAYTITYSDSPTDLWMENARWGIFVDKHLVFSSKGEKPPAFTLIDAGQVIPKITDQADPPSVPPAPKYLPTGILGRSTIQPIFKPALLGAVGLFPMLRTNARGQVLIPVNFAPDGFLLLLGTPVAH